jgi:hypothetical protein
MTMLLLTIQYKAPNIKIKFNMKELSQLENINSELFIKTFNSELKEKFGKLVSYHLGLNAKRTTVKSEPFVHIYSEDPKFLAYINEVCKKINSSSETIYKTITNKDIGTSELELKDFFRDYFAQKIIEHNKQQGLSFIRLKKNKNSLSINLDLKKYELSTLDNFGYIFKTEATKQINDFQASYYPNEKFDIKTSEGFTVVCSNSNALEELQKIFKKINIHSAYFYDRVNEDKYDFFSNEFPIFLKQNFEKEILIDKFY